MRTGVSIVADMICYKRRYGKGIAMRNNVVKLPQTIRIRERRRFERYYRRVLRFGAFFSLAALCFGFGEVEAFSQAYDSSNPSVYASTAPKTRPASDSVSARERKDSQNIKETSSPDSVSSQSRSDVLVLDRAPSPNSSSRDVRQASAYAQTSKPRDNSSLYLSKDIMRTNATRKRQTLQTKEPSSAYSEQVQESHAETLEEATRIALAESRTQRALALKNGASRSTVEAARSLRKPKVTNATSYVGMLNQPATVSDLDLSNVAAGVAAADPSLAPVISQLPTQYQIETPLCDRNFVTTVTAVSLPIYLGGRINALTREAEAMAQATQAGMDVGEQTVKFQVSEAYFLVLRTRQLRQVAVEAVQTAEEHYSDSERMFDVGLLTRNVVLAAQVALSETRQTELKVANAQQLAEAAYNRLLWRPLDAPVVIADVELGAPLGDLETLTSQAVQTRGELQVLSAESRALQEQVRVARADVLPQVAVVGAYSYFENSHLRDNSNATAAVGLTWTPIDGGTSRARQNAARQNAMAVARVRDEAESGIRLQVRQAWLAEQEARERVEVARVAVEQAEENLRVVTRGFQEGAVNHTETLDAATMRTAAKSNYTNACYDAILATQRLRYAVGIL